MCLCLSGAECKITKSGVNLSVSATVLTGKEKKITQKREGNTYEEAEEEEKKLNGQKH